MAKKRNKKYKRKINQQRFRQNKITKKKVIAQNTANKVFAYDVKLIYQDLKKTLWVSLIVLVTLLLIVWQGK